ncbi:inverse autotransporter beta domain-containing protein, partial [Aeromonas jandaei]|uniref:inverse autotransporter beta domain-containing protein n=1 Tax=Aeromonas jandaei TaxID=650 RepID=UPI003EC5052D
MKINKINKINRKKGSRNINLRLRRNSKLPDVAIPSSLHFYIVWLNIMLQFLYPVMLVFTPTVRAAQQPANSSNSQVVEVLNNEQTLPDLGSSISSTPSFDAQALESTMATIATDVGQMLSNSNVGDVAKSRAISASESAANSAINSWAGQFGTASFSIDSTGKGTIDFLLSVLDGNDYLFYTQLGARTDSDRSFINAGIGSRYFLSDLMVGVNSFYDYDLTGYNRRLGIGVEAWRDYFKLAANGYFRLNDWQQSVLDEMVDYNERPANGMDIRLQAYIPSYPQLGGNVTFEQYWGNEVALVSSNERAKNPFAFSYGAEYTPFPLLSFGIGHKHSGSSHEATVAMELNFQLGVSLDKQLDGGSVAQSRTLMGSRYDLVDRNHHIIMEYQKQTLVSLALQSSGVATAGSVVTITPTVTAKYGVEKINWDAAALLMDGGSLTEQGNAALLVTLPAIKSGGQPPTYIIGGVAVDRKGNRSERATVVIQMVQGESVSGNPALMLSKSQALANGTDEIAVDVLVTQDSTPVSGETVELSLANLTARAEFPKRLVTTDENGKASTTLVSTRAGEADLQATLVSNGAMVTERIAFIADESTAKYEALSVEADNAMANGTSENRVRAVIGDAHGNPVSGVSVDFTATNGATISSPHVTDQTGVAIASLTNTHPGPSEVTATVNGLSQSVLTTFRVDSSGWVIADEASDFVVDTGAVANGTASNAVRAVVTDARGNLVPDVDVTFAVAGEARFGGMEGAQTVTVRTDANGVASTELVSQVAGDNQVTAQVGSVTTVAKVSRFVAD